MAEKCPTIFPMAHEVGLTKVQRNGLMESLLKGGLNAADCKFRQRIDTPAARLANVYEVTHTSTDSTFRLTGLTADGEWQIWMQSGTDPSSTTAAG
jgi:hypothetical protein